MNDRPQLDLDDYFPYLVNRVGFALVARFQESLDPHGLSIGMWRVLAVLSSRGELRQIDLAKMTSIDTSTLSRLITRAVRMGLLTRTRSQTSHREVAVRLSPKGRTVVERLIPIARRLEQDTVAGLSSRQMAAARDALRAMYGNLAPASAGAAKRKRGASHRRSAGLRESGNAR